MQMTFLVGFGFTPTIKFILIITNFHCIAIFSSYNAQPNYRDGLKVETLIKNDNESKLNISLEQIIITDPVKATVILVLSTVLVLKVQFKLTAIVIVIVIMALIMIIIIIK